MTEKKRVPRFKGLLLSLFLFLGAVCVFEGTEKILFPLKYSEFVFRYSTEYNVDPFLVFAVIKAESGFDPEAISRKNARGLMQISEKTAEWGARSLKLEGFTPEQLYNPEINIRIGCWYINRLMQEFPDSLDLVITAYNGGSGNVVEWLKNRDYSNSGTSLDKIPYRETLVFVKRVKNYNLKYREIYGPRDIPLQLLYPPSNG